jgi:hypothetical protein
LKLISSIAASTHSSIRVIGAALFINFNTETIDIEYPVFGTCQADGVFPIPRSTPSVLGFIVVGWRIDA